VTPLFRKFVGIHWLLFATMAALLVAGVVAIYSAVEFREEAAFNNLWRKQVLMIGIGMVAFFGAALIDYKWVRWGAIPAYAGGLALLMVVQLAGTEVNSSKSWLDLGGFRFQPSQAAMAAGILMLAFVLAELNKFHPILRNHFLRLLIAGIVGGVPCLMVLKEGDFGSASVWLPVMGAMLFVGSIPMRYIITIVLIGLMIVPLVYFFKLEDYQQSRITTALDVLQGKEIDRQGEGYATYHITNAIGSAGWEGKGFLASKVEGQKSIHRMGFLPKNTAHNDYIFAVIAEEHGYRGCMILLGTLAALMLQGIWIAFRSRDPLGRLIAIGTTSLLFAHTFQHVGMQVHLLPITGLPLPFISYGGSFLIISLFLMGMTQSVWIHRNMPVERKKKSSEQ
jgi:rod shape determining protein RodA